MASDASSGPKHRYENGESGHGMGHFKNYENDNGSKYFSYKKKANKQMEMRKEEGRRIKVDKKEEPVHLRSNNPTTSLPTSTKARKLKWMGKGK
ncbi:hypothetical protein BVC80_9011g38 [Macleaya cordata]|uniref:Uncharacterized protein n=1 Tax=Macleaya cordata TaxID=56857 RepID=A0A200QPX5_MACCD|nr:hypothetical protein BVC80_9011g38 [Macleaya cordata]